MALISVVHTLISENSTGTDIIIASDESVVTNVRNAGAFTVQCGEKTIKEECRALAVNTSTMTMEKKAVTKVMEWLKTESVPHV